MSSNFSNNSCDFIPPFQNVNQISEIYHDSDLDRGNSSSMIDDCYLNKINCKDHYKDKYNLLKSRSRPVPQNKQDFLEGDIQRKQNNNSSLMANKSPIYQQNRQPLREIKIINGTLTSEVTNENLIIKDLDTPKERKNTQGAKSMKMKQPPKNPFIDLFRMNNIQYKSKMIPKSYFLYKNFIIEEDEKEPKEIPEQTSSQNNENYGAKKKSRTKAKEVFESIQEDDEENNEQLLNIRIPLDNLSQGSLAQNQFNNPTKSKRITMAPPYDNFRINLNEDNHQEGNRINNINNMNNSQILNNPN